MWRQHTKIIKIFNRFFYNQSNRDSEFLEKGLKIGRLPEDQTAALQNILRNVPVRKIQAEDFYPGYINNPYIEDSISDFESSFRFYEFSNEVETLSSVLTPLSSKVKACLGYPVRIVNVRCWGISPKTPEMGPNAWHTDHFADGINKILIYLTPANSEMGTTEIQLRDNSVCSLDGPAGSWVLFNPSEFVHRGISPSTGERIIMEITIAPSFRGNLRPVFAGLNASYPWFPWTKAKAQLNPFHG